MSSKRSTKAAPGPADEQPKPIPAPFHETYGPLLDGMPASVIEKIKARSEVRGLDLSADDDAVRDLVESAHSAYQKKKESSRLAAAKRRASKKSAAAALEAAVEPLEAAVEPLEAAVEPLEAEAAVESPAEP